jgi:hypothetical protein
MGAIVTTGRLRLNAPEHLLRRLDAIGHALRDSGQGLALIGLGSVGRDTARLDAWSDLDFFAIVEPGAKLRYLHSLDWLAAAHPLAWHFQNTVDGHKALMADGVFCEFAVFEPQELAAIPFAPGRVVWKRIGVDEAIAVPRQAPPPTAPPDEAWVVGEALSCLFVGLQRWHRGEKLSAARFVQGYAVDRLLELDALREPAATAGADPFNRERRLEARRPSLAAELPALVPGYERTPQAALALLQALAARGAVLHPAMVERIRALAR